MLISTLFGASVDCTDAWAIKIQLCTTCLICVVNLCATLWTERQTFTALDNFSQGYEMTCLHCQAIRTDKSYVCRFINRYDVLELNVIR